MTTSVSWYREPWPWLLAAGPAIVIVAGIYTAYLAIVSADGVVADDYYKRGLAINRELARDERAASAALSAEMSREGNDVVVSLDCGTPSACGGMRLRIVNPARAEDDQRLEVKEVAPGRFVARLTRDPVRHARFVLEAPAWRLIGQGALGEGAIALRPAGTS